MYERFDLQQQLEVLIVLSVGIGTPCGPRTLYMLPERPACSSCGPGTSLSFPRGVWGVSRLTLVLACRSGAAGLLPVRAYRAGYLRFTMYIPPVCHELPAIQSSDSRAHISHLVDERRLVFWIVAGSAGQSESVVRQTCSACFSKGGRWMETRERGVAAGELEFGILSAPVHVGYT